MQSPGDNVRSDVLESGWAARNASRIVGSAMAQNRVNH